jgi:hypothetical protein
MKRFLMIALAVLVSVAFVTTVFAQTATEKATKAATETATEKGKAVGDKATQTVTGKPSVEADKAPVTDKAGKEESAPCKQIAQICKKAGFVSGEADKGYGLNRDCIHPIMQGKTAVPGAKKPLPTVDPKLVAQCKAKDPDYGSGKVGSKK